MTGTHRDELRKLLIEQRKLLLATDHTSDLAAANSTYQARRTEISVQLAVIHGEDPFRWSNIWHWVGECAGLDEERRARLLDAESDPILTILSGTTLEPAPYVLELYERDGDPDDIPLERFAFELSEAKRAALLAALERVLAYQGTGVVSSGWGKALGEGLYELKVRKTAKEIAALFPRSEAKTPVPAALMEEDVLLRVFFAPRGHKLLLILSGYDKAADDKDRRQQEEIKQARKYLREYDRRLKRGAKGR